MFDFIFDLGDVVKDKITGLTGVVTCRTQWLNNCNTYGVQSRDLHDGKRLEREHFDEPQLELAGKNVFRERRETGGPERAVPRTNR